MILDKEHLAMTGRYMVDATLVAFLWTWQMVFPNITLNVSWGNIENLTEIVDTVLRFAITILILLTAWIRYKKEKRKNDIK